MSFIARAEYMIHFGRKYCNFQCPSMASVLRKSKGQSDNNHTVMLDPYINCPHFGDKYDDSHEFVLDHLSSYDHFLSFGIVSTCQYVFW